MDNKSNKKIIETELQNPNFDKSNQILEEKKNNYNETTDNNNQQDLTIENNQLKINEEQNLEIPKKFKKKKKKFKNLISEIMLENKKDELTEKEEHLNKIKKSLGGGTFKKIDKI